jgi:hypothetical protein
MLATRVGAEWVVLSAHTNSRTYELYLAGGMSAAIPLSAMLESERRVVLPSPIANQRLPNAQPIRQRAGIASVVPELFGGFGIAASIPGVQRWMATLDVRYIYPLASILDDASWTIERLQLGIGLRYRF